MGRAVKRNLWKYGPSVDIGCGLGVVPLAGAGGAPARGVLGVQAGFWQERIGFISGLIVRKLRRSVNQCALAATVPAMAPMTNHFMARPSRWRREPPRARFSAASRSLPRAWVLVFSSARSAVAVARRVW